MRALPLGKLEDERQYLVYLIELNQPQGSLKNQVTIVFDGRSGFWSGPSSSSVRIIFSDTESADNKIKKIIAESFTPKNFVVITDDRDIRYAVRAMGAALMSVKDFLKKIEPSAKKAVRGSSQGSGANKNISKTLEFKITSELEQIWLKKKEKKSQE